MYCKDLVTNLSTALMAVKEMATYNNIPIEIHFENHYIHIFVGYGAPYQKYMRFYPQDCYRLYSDTDDMRKWIENAIEEIQKEKSERGFTSKEMVEIGDKLNEGFKEGTKKAIDPAERNAETGKSIRELMRDIAGFCHIPAEIAIGAVTDKWPDPVTPEEEWPDCPEEVKKALSEWNETISKMRIKDVKSTEDLKITKKLKEIREQIEEDTKLEGYRTDWTPPELEKLGIPYPVTEEYLEEWRQRAEKLMNEGVMSLDDIKKKLGIVSPSKTEEEISLTERPKLTTEHLVDVTCSWHAEVLQGDRLYVIGPGFTRDDLTPYELYLLKKSEAHYMQKKE